MDDFFHKLSYWLAAFLSGLSFLNINHYALIFGMLISLATFIMTWIYKHKTFIHMTSKDQDTQ